MAVEKNLLFAVDSNQSSSVNLFNTDPKYADFSSCLKDIKISQIQPQWFDYFLSGFKGVRDDDGPFGSNNNLTTTGLDVCLSSSLPAASGLSSSSALVCGSAVATLVSLLTANNSGGDFGLYCKIDKKMIASLAASSERMIGVEGGGMDQAIEMLAQKNSAKFISFYPKLTAESIKIPDGISFILSHSGSRCNKGATGDYNTRVFETKIAACIIAKNHPEVAGLELPNPDMTLHYVQRTLGYTLEQMVDEVNLYIKEDSFTKSDLMQYFNVSTENELFGLFCHERTYQRMAQVVNPGTSSSVRSFKLKDRSKHVYLEAARVIEFRENLSVPRHVG